MKGWKIILSIGIIIFVIGIGVLVAGFAYGGWKFGSKLDMQTFTSEEDNASLDLSLAAGEMKVEYYDGENIEVDYPTAYPFRYEVKESGGKLTVAPANNRVFFGWMPWFAKPKVTVRIPQGKVMNLKLSVSAGAASVASGDFGTFNLELSAGYVKIGNVQCSSFKADLSAGSANIDGLKCDNLKVALSAGSTSINGVECDDIKVDLSAGSANLTVNGAKSDYFIYVDKSAGSCNVSGQQGAVAGKIIDVDLSAGSVNIHFNG